MKLLIFLMAICPTVYADDFLQKGKQLLVCVREGLKADSPFSRSVVRINWEDFEKDKVFKIKEKDYLVKYHAVLEREEALPEYVLEINFHTKNEGGGSFIRVNSSLENNIQIFRGVYIDSSLSDAEAFEKCVK